MGKTFQDRGNAYFLFSILHVTTAPWKSLEYNLNES